MTPFSLQPSAFNLQLAAPIQTTGLTKDYGAGRGLFALDLAIQPGEVFGFLGPNGAGKTTTLRLLMGLIRPTSGDARVFGLDCWRDPVAVKRRVGYLPGELPDWGGWRGDEIVATMAGLRGGTDNAVVADLCARLDLDLARRWREYSRGNKQKLGLLLAFMHQPDLLILDEPTSGLDPLHQQTFAALVQETRLRGATVFLSSHVLSEAEQICDRVGMLRAGRLIALGQLGELRGLGAKHLEINFATTPPADRLHAIPGLDHLAITGTQLTATLQGEIGPLLRVLADLPVLSLTSRDPSLEELFLGFYGERSAGRVTNDG